MREYTDEELDQMMETVPWLEIPHDAHIAMGLRNHRGSEQDMELQRKLNDPAKRCHMCSWFVPREALGVEACYRATFSSFCSPDPIEEYPAFCREFTADSKYTLLDLLKILRSGDD